MQNLQQLFYRSILRRNACTVKRFENPLMNIAKIDLFFVGDGAGYGTGCAADNGASHRVGIQQYRTYGAGAGADCAAGKGALAGAFAAACGGNANEKRKGNNTIFHKILTVTVGKDESSK